MKVCILGSGITSLSLAKTLINKGLSVDLISNDQKNFYDKSQTIGISKSNVDFFNTNILNINKLLWKINKIEVYSENLNNKKILDFEHSNKELFSIIKNYELYNLLFKILKKNKFFKVKKKTKKILVNKEYDLVINSDTNHFITKKHFFKKFSKNYDSYGHVTIIKHERLKNKTATQIFTKKGPLAFLPISETETSIVYSEKKEEIIKKDKLERLIQKFLKKYTVNKIYSPKSFQLKSSNLRTYKHKNILAFGDLLHRLHPHAGQGFNMTIRDIKVLLELINFRINLGIQLDQSICSEFEKRTKSKNFLFSNGVDLIYEFFNLEGKVNTNMMSKSVQILGKNNLLKKYFIKLADKGISI